MPDKVLYLPDIVRFDRFVSKNHLSVSRIEKSESRLEDTIDSQRLESSEIKNFAEGHYLLLTSLHIMFEKLLQELTEWCDIQGQLLGCNFIIRAVTSVARKEYFYREQ